MTEHNSPNFALGVEDGEIDAVLVTSCPSVSPIGPRPPNPHYPVMYNRGYERGYGDAVPHCCTKECRQ